MSYKPPLYPDTLTNKGWQKSKGLIAKAAGETGIGDLLKTMESAYSAVEWRKLELYLNCPQGAKRTQEAIEGAYADALKQGAKLKALDTACRAAEKAARELGVKWKKDKGIPSSSVKTIGTIEDDAKALNYATAMGTVTQGLQVEKKELEDQLLVLAAEYKKLNLKLKKYVDGFEQAVQGKKLDDYGAIWKEHIRGVGTVLPTLIKDHPEFETEWKIWKNFSNSEKKPDSEDAMQKQVAMLVKVSKSLKPKVDKLF